MTEAAACRKAWPRDKAMGMRLSATDWVEGGLTLEDTIARARQAGKTAAAAAAQQWRDALWKTLDPTRNLAWEDGAQYQQQRRRLADRILALMKAGVPPAVTKTE